MRMDPFADALSNIKNHENVGKTTCVIKPANKLVQQVLQIMKNTGYVTNYSLKDDGKAGQIHVELSGKINDCGAIKPRFSSKYDEFEKWEKRYLPAQGFGILIVSTPLGVMTQREAKEKKTGGKLLAYVY